MTTNFKTALLLGGIVLATLCTGFGQPVITMQPQSQSVSLGANVTFSVSIAGGVEPLSYQWRLNETALAGETNATLTLMNVQVAQAGSYTAVVIDGFEDSVTSEAAMLTVDPTFSKVTSGPIATDIIKTFGCAWGDYDGDGYLDLFVGNGSGDANALYHNNRNGTFTAITSGPVATEIGDSSGCVWADYDNDGHLDLFVANWRLPSFLFRNNGDGAFTKITGGSLLSNTADSNGCAWGDYDNDGFLDLLVANTSGQDEFLYRNNGDGTFAQILAGDLVMSGGDSGGPLWADYDNDGALDLFVSNSGATDQNFLFRNNRDGSFGSVTNAISSGVGGGGCDWGDYDNDADLDLFITVWGGASGANDLLYRNEGGGVFTSITSGPIVTSRGSSQSAAWADYDNDGWLDLFVANDFGQNNFLFHNNGNGTFTRMTEGSVVNDGGHSIGCTWGDYDNDGFLDLFVSNGIGPDRERNFLYHNNGNGNRWLSIKCIGTASNRSGIGAKVRVQAFIGGVTRWQLREINTGNGYSGSGLRAHFGLGDTTNVTLVRIEWPSGTVQELQNVMVNQILTAHEPPVLRILGKDVSGSSRLSLKGGLGLPYTVEYSTNLIHWNSLTNFAPTNIVSSLDDAAAASSPQRFYRARQDD